MPDHDDHIQHTWILTHPTGDEVTIDLWTDDETVHVDGGDGESYTTSSNAGRGEIEQSLLPKYRGRGYLLVRDYAVNDPHEPVLPDDQPDECRQCGSDTEYVPDHYDGTKEGPAWLCTGCNWGQWSAGT